MIKYTYHNCLVKIQDLQLIEDLWQGTAMITFDHGNSTIDQQIIISAGASSEEMAFTMAARQCNRWIDENTP